MFEPSNHKDGVMKCFYSHIVLSTSFVFSIFVYICVINIE